MTAWAEPAAAWLVILAAVLAVDRSFVARSHWPIAVALCLAMFEPLRPDEGATAKVVCIGLHALSTWAVVQVLGRRRLLALCAAALIVAVGAGVNRRLGWDASVTWTACASAGAQVLAVLAVAPRRRLWLADRCAIVLAVGDVAALLGPAGERAPAHVRAALWWVVQWQAAAVALVLCLLHVHQALMDRRRRAP